MDWGSAEDVRESRGKKKPASGRDSYQDVDGCKEVGLWGTRSWVPIGYIEAAHWILTWKCEVVVGVLSGVQGEDAI